MNNLNNLEKLNGVYIKFKGTIGKEDNCDFKKIPCMNIESGDMYVVIDNGWYKTVFTDENNTSHPFEREVLFNKGDILILLETTNFFIFNKNNWVCIRSREGEINCENEKIKAFVSYPFIDFVNEDYLELHNRVLENFSSLSHFIFSNKDMIINEEYDNTSLIKKYNDDTVNFLLKRIKTLSEADRVYFCKGWEKDTICNFEYLIAKKLHKKIISYPEICG